MADINVAPSILQQPANLYQQILANQGTQANTALTGQQAQGAAIANQRAGMQLEAYKGLLGLLNQQNQQTSPQEQTSENQSGVDEAPTLEGGHIDRGAVSAHVDSQFQQAAYIPSARIRMINSASAAAGAPEIGQAYMAAEKAQWDKTMQGRQIGADQLLKQVYSLQDAVKGGTGIAQLGDMPGGRAAAAELLAKQKQYGWSDAELNQHVGEWADAVGGAVFRHTGREISDNNGTPFDKQSGRPVPGGIPAPLSAQQYQTARVEWSKPVVYGAGLPEAPYKHFGYASADDAIRANPQGPPQQAATGAATPATPTPQNAAPAPANAAQQATAQPKPAATATPAQPPAGPNASAAAPATPLPGGVKPQAFADSDFRTPPLPKVTDQVSLKNANDQQAIRNKNEQTLKDNVGTQASISATLKPYLDIAQKYMESGGAITGWAAEDKLKLAQMLDSVKPGLSSMIGNPANTFIVMKNLGNAALQGARATYGSRMSTNEVQLQLKQLSASTGMDPAAIKNLITEAQAAAEYDKDSNDLMQRYLKNGYNPEQSAFQSWQDKYHNRSQFIQNELQYDKNQTINGVRYHMKDGQIYRD